ncbi:hypothetical protein Pmani_026285 [Petrolisthes manimaculis]|uniref:Uncharacterized protein n=1 Tax=Petrolisthes manimaculis TaxID=1843537 RepID=A0AAE1P6A5_9EUCA|nr:hypothetical protein Pmani_026285 [Petrolisthes manimaculis]
MWRSGNVLVVVVMMVVVATVQAKTPPPPPTTTTPTTNPGPSRILVLDLLGSRSHKQFIMTIAEELAARNHSITYLTGFESTRERPNIREIYVPGVSLFTMITNTFNTSYFQMFKILLPELHKLCPNLLATQEFQSFHQEGGKFDLVISGLMSLDCFLPYVHTLQVPLVYVFPNMVQGSMDDVAGTPFFHSLGGSMVLSEQFPYSFKCRLIVTFHAEFAKFINVWYSLPNVKTLETPTMPYTPTVVHAGGIHCRPPHPLPQDLEEWVSGSGDAGFILFSLGSIVKPSDMPIQMREEVQRRSVVMRDQPVPPGEWVTYWIEYVIRHRGAVHLRSPAVHMPW